MKKFTLISIAILLGVITNGYGQSISNLANIDQYILNQMALLYKPGVAACIVKGDSTVWSGNYGYAILEDSTMVTNNTLFNAFSIGKSITASCVFQLCEDQLLNLDENINNFLPFQIDNPYIQPDSITVRMLMSHSSSIVDFNMLSYVTVGDPTESLASFLENYLSASGAYYGNGYNNFSNNTPGTNYSYTNFGAALNGYLIEPLIGMNFNEYAQEYMLNPLEMEVSTWFLDELNMEYLATGYNYTGGNYQPYLHYSIPAYPGVSLRSNVFDLANYVIMLLNKGSYKGIQVLESVTVDSMMVLQPPFFHCGLGLYHSEIWNNAGTFQREIWGHKGGGDFGYAGEIQYCKDDFTGVVYLSNSQNYSSNILKTLFDYAAMLVIAEPAVEITDSEFTAVCQSAPDATGYFLDVSEDESFSSFFEEYENFDMGIDTMYTINNLSSITDYYYRLRAYNEYDTGAYSNTVSLTTLLTGFINKLEANMKVWSTNKTVFIELPQNTGLETNATFYSFTGQLMGRAKLTEGINSIRMDIRKQPIIIKINAGNKSYCKKVMMW